MLDRALDDEEGPLEEEIVLFRAGGDELEFRAVLVHLDELAVGTIDAVKRCTVVEHRLVLPRDDILLSADVEQSRVGGNLVSGKVLHDIVEGFVVRPNVRLGEEISREEVHGLVDEAEEEGVEAGEGVEDGEEHAKGDQHGRVDAVLVQQPLHQIRTGDLS
ncbi:hypothetical protein ABW21_db0200730 [Orbilia brochopaga]|nr:hypothetical protein ABW21_db0200730 [Drechslerella brochopaga]